MVDAFHRYIVAASGEKMYRRVTHVYSRRLLENLGTLMPRKMQNIFKKFAPQMKTSSRRDSSLGSLLVALDQQGALENILEWHLEGYEASTESQPGCIKRLVSAFQTTLSSQPQEGMGAYNEQTCYPFHLLLFATINGFTQSLEFLHDASKAKDNEYANRAESRVKHANRVVQFGRLLRLFAYSQMLTLHLELLEAGNVLQSPYNTHSDRMGNSAPDGGGNEDEDEDNEVAEELGRSEKDKAATFRRWIQLLISYWVATDTVAKFSAHQGTNDTNITLIHVRAELGRKMAPWHATIRRLASLPAAADSEHPFDAEAAIASFVKRIEDPNLDDYRVKAFREAKRCIAVSTDGVVFSANIHCEVAVVTLLAYTARVKVHGPKGLAQLFKVLTIIFITNCRTDFSYRMQTQSGSQYPSYAALLAGCS